MNDLVNAWFGNTVSFAGCGGSLIAIAFTGALETSLPACATPLGWMIRVPGLNSRRSLSSHIAPLLLTTSVLAFISGGGLGQVVEFRRREVDRRAQTGMELRHHR